MTKITAKILIVDDEAPQLKALCDTLMEHGYEQAAATASLLHAAGYRHIQTWSDSAGKERVSGGQRA